MSSSVTSTLIKLFEKYNCMQMGLVYFVSAQCSLCNVEVLLNDEFNPDADDLSSKSANRSAQTEWKSFEFLLLR